MYAFVHYLLCYRSQSGGGERTKRQRSMVLSTALSTFTRCKFDACVMRLHDVCYYKIVGFLFKPSILKDYTLESIQRQSRFPLERDSQLNQISNGGCSDRPMVFQY